MARNIHPGGSSRLTRRRIRATVCREAGMVVFREFKRRRIYALPLEHWIGKAMRTQTVNRRRS